MIRLKLWPVVAGILVDSLGSVAVGLLYIVGVLVVELARGRELTEQTLDSNLDVTTFLGLFVTAVGGFVAGRMAKMDEIRHGAAVGVGSLLIWFLLNWVVPADGPWTLVEMLSFLAVIPAAALGGYAAGRMNTRSARAT